MRTAFCSRLLEAERRVYEIERFICIIALAVILVCVLVSVFVRYFHLPIPNVGEYAIIAMAPLTFIGAAMCSYTGTHITIDVIHSFAKPALRRAARFAVSIAMLVFSGVYLWTGARFLRTTWLSGETLVDLGTPLAVPLSFLPLGMLFVLVHALSEFVRSGFGDAAPAEVSP